MKKLIRTSHRIEASAEIVWKHLRHGQGVDEWLALITDCKLMGKGEGAKRVCATEHGAIQETILKVDDIEKVFQYSIDQQPLLPIDKIIATMQIVPRDGRSELLWDLEFDLLDEDRFLDVKESIEGMYASGARGLEALSNS